MIFINWICYMDICTSRIPFTKVKSNLFKVFIAHKNRIANFPMECTVVKNNNSEQDKQIPTQKGLTRNICCTHGSVQHEYNNAFMLGIWRLTRVQAQQAQMFLY